MSAYFRRDARQLSPGDIEIRAADDGAPEAFIAGAPSGLHVSISHSAGLAASAVSAAPVGCDLEAIAASTVNVIGDFFTAEEQAAVAAARGDQRALRATVIWSAKESVLKLDRVGLRRDTREVVITTAWGACERDWTPFQARSEGIYEGWWMWVDGYVLSVVSRSRACPPVRLSG